MLLQRKPFNDLEYLLPESDLNLQSYFDKLDYLDRLANLEVLSYMEMTANTEKNKMKLRHMPAIYPVSLEHSKLTSRFGYRKIHLQKRGKNTKVMIFLQKQERLWLLLLTVL